MKLHISITATLSGLILSLIAVGQTTTNVVDTLQAKALKLFVGCQSCDLDYFKTNITFVNYVRDPNEADVHFQLTSQTTGSGGTEYTLLFIGKMLFENVNDTLIVSANKTDSQDMTRKSLLKALTSGLIRYLNHTPLAEYISIGYNRAGGSAKPLDVWDSWIVSFNLNGWLNGETQYKSSQMWGGISIGRIAEDWKFMFSMNMSYNENIYHFETNDTTTVDSRAINRSQWLNGSAVKSLTDHWSAGIFASANSATYSNIDLSISMKPAIEYNIFPYKESTLRQLRFIYRIGVNMRRYMDTTIYFKKSEVLYSHALSVTLWMQQQWGSASVTLSGSQYLHDLSKNNYSIYGNVSVRVIEGLSLNLSGGYSAVHDQLSLRKSSLTPEEVYQQRRELTKNYSYWASYGLSYTFGSIFNNVVNPRMSDFD